MSADWITPDWPAPQNVRALSTTRQGGVSQPPWDSLNLGEHVGDDPLDVRRNRARLRSLARLPGEPLWLEQIHGCGVRTHENTSCRADACFSRAHGQVCAVMTADCLPVLLCDQTGSAVAAVHAGWRGLAGGVVEQALHCFAQPASAIMAWLGPAIGPAAFEVGGDVRDAFLRQHSQAESAFVPHGSGKWLANIYGLARQRLQAQGVSRIYGGDFCTYTESTRFFSYRRDGNTGRMASLIWLEKSHE
ncbi:MAG TPA: peptidoglycan editing factor PgeF [Chromatiaceae bacterium]|nr:peptidoglycan editing factor PgeF [Chromatiaceae bacterium]